MWRPATPAIRAIPARRPVTPAIRAIPARQPAIPAILAAACNPCNPCGACNPCAGGAAPELTTAELTAVYDCLEQDMTASYGKSDNHRALEFRSYRTYSKAPLRVGHPRRALRHELRQRDGQGLRRLREGRNLPARLGPGQAEFLGQGQRQGGARSRCSSWRRWRPASMPTATTGATP